MFSIVFFPSRQADVLRINLFHFAAPLDDSLLFFADIYHDDWQSNEEKMPTFLTIHVSSFFLFFSLGNLVKTFNGNELTIEPKSRAKQWLLFYHRHWLTARMNGRIFLPIVFFCSDCHFTFICNAIKASGKIDTEDCFAFGTRNDVSVFFLFSINIIYICECNTRKNANQWNFASWQCFIFLLFALLQLDLISKIQLEPI